VAEGRRQLEHALAAGAHIDHVYVSPSLYLGADDEALVCEAARRGARVVELGPRAFLSITSQVRADGIAAVVRRPQRGLRGYSGWRPQLVARQVIRPQARWSIAR